MREGIVLEAAALPVFLGAADDVDDTSIRQRLLEIADKCPVHKTLHSEVVVETREARA